MPGIRRICRMPNLLAILRKLHTVLLPLLLRDTVIRRLGRSLEQQLRSTQHTIRLRHGGPQPLQQVPLGRPAKVSDGYREGGLGGGVEKALRGRRSGCAGTHCGAQERPRLGPAGLAGHDDGVFVGLGGKRDRGGVEEGENRVFHVMVGFMTAWI